MGDKISSEQTFSTTAGELKISCLTKSASPSLDFSIALAITVFKASIYYILKAQYGGLKQRHHVNPHHLN
jgi:hypothetical protein